ncbi:uncharacterized protein L203_102733 [Cryptococcus depauperatus CBS 7841]|uniref:Uncharacterized protein n=1 Tax=Cryptococcus depauperatus CBS 7841 TaxID=1295531 RepID=A0AAJ8M033_9TREE
MAGDCREILWHGWTCTIAKDVEGKLQKWGNDPVLLETIFNSQPVGKFISFNEPTTLLGQDGHVYPSNKNTKSCKTWDDAAMTGLGDVYAYRRKWNKSVLWLKEIGGDGVYRFESLQDLLNDKPLFGPLSHPLLKNDSSLKLFAAESRVFVLSPGPMPHVFEVHDIRGLPPNLKSNCEGPVFVQLHEDLEGLGVTQLVQGFSNRFMALTEAGDAYLLAPKVDMELVDVGDEAVRLAGVGSDFEVVVTEKKIYVRGANDFGQLGLPKSPTLEDFTQLELENINPNQIVRVHTSRWSTILCVKAE